MALSPDEREELAEIRRGLHMLRAEETKTQGDLWELLKRSSVERVDVRGIPP